jgi:phospholipid transport system substrate-binding protein
MKSFSPSLARFAFAIGLVCAGAATTRAADPALEVMQTSYAELMAIIYDQPPSGELLSTRVRPVLEKYFDFEYTTRSAIGPGWRQFTPEQQQKSVQLFTSLVIRTYVDRFKPTSRPEIAWGTPATPADKRREIPSTITYENEQYSVLYKLRETAQGWRLYDVVAENVSMVANYRAQFEEIFRKGGAEAVLRALENNELTAASGAAQP